LAGDAPNLPETVSLRLPSPYSPAAIPRLARHLARTVRPGDVVHAHLFPTSAYLVALRRAGLLRGTRLVFTEHSTANRRRGTRLGRLVDRAVYAEMDEVIAISEGTADALVNWMPDISGRIRVVHNGVPLRHGAVTFRRPNDRPRVVSLGNLRYTKNYGVALEAVALLRDLDFEYDIAGEGVDRPMLEAKIDALGLSHKVRLLGYVNDPYELLHTADVFFMPSIIEGFGLAAVEAMNASLPIVASAVPGLREVIGDTCCGRLVDPRSPADMAGALRAVLTTDDAGREAMGRAAFARAQAFDENVMIEGYLSCYHGENAV
jgi:glycosyltransferase involved in cell wall biosynthesis